MHFPAHAILLASILTLTSIASAQSVAATSTSDSGPVPGPDSTSLPDIASICLPKQSNGTLDGTAPCHQLLLQSVECLAFSDDGGNATAAGKAGAGIDGLGANAVSEAVSQIGARVQNLFNGTLDQQCVCKSGQLGSSYFENLAGCSECLRLHGIKKDWFPAQLVPSASSSYCAMTSPTVNVADYLREYVATASTPDLGTSTVTDVLGTSTAVSNYFTSTGAASATASSSGSAGSTSSSGSVGSTSSSSSGGAGPVATSAQWSGMALVGVLGFAVMI